MQVSTNPQKIGVIQERIYNPNNVNTLHTFISLTAVATSWRKRRETIFYTPINYSNSSLGLMRFRITLTTLATNQARVTLYKNGEVVYDETKNDGVESTNTTDIDVAIQQGDVLEFWGGRLSGTGNCGFSWLCRGEELTERSSFNFTNEIFT